MTEADSTTSTGALRRYLQTCRQMPPRDRRNSWRATGWLFLWMVTFVATLLGMKLELVPPGPLTYAAIAFSTLFGVVAVLAYVRFVREADELQRRIQTEAFSLGFGGGFIATFALSLLERTELYEADLGDPFMVMVISYLVGIWLAARRYA